MVVRWGGQVRRDEQLSVEDAVASTNGFWMTVSAGTAAIGRAGAQARGQQLDN
jgi:hypothetical protein